MDEVNKSVLQLIEDYIRETYDMTVSEFNDRFPNNELKQLVEYLENLDV